MQVKLIDLINESRKVGLEINENKSKVLTINCEENLILKANDVPLETFEQCPYLGIIIISDGRTTTDIPRRINKARGVWRSKYLKLD